MALVAGQTQSALDPEAEYHRGLRDRFAGAYSPPAVPDARATGDSLAGDRFAAASQAYEDGYRQGDPDAQTP